MPPLRTMPTIKPTKTERSHEENQERAYIAASRRSDRSLEARVESARRASEIHEKRTGRKLRVTEQDVINEEMYEEEDDNVPWRYRHLAMLPNLSTLSPEFRRRVEAQLVLEMERSRMVDPNGQFQSPGPYLNPGMMQMPQSGQQSPMFPPSMFQFGQQTPAMSPHTPQFPQMSSSMSIPQNSRQSSTQRHSPYSTQVRPSPHQRSASIATPQELSGHQSKYQKSSSGVDDEERRYSLPPTNVKIEKTQSNGHTTPPAMSRTNSNQSRVSHHSPSQTHAQSQQQRQQSFAAQYAGSMNNSFNPLTPTLPLNTQQLLGDGMFGLGDDFKPNMMKPNATGMQQPMYSYNPNGTQKSSKKRTFDDISHLSHSSGLDQTLMPTSLDTSVSEPGKGYPFNAPFSAGSNYLGSAITDPGYGFGFDDEFGFDLFKSSQSSGHPSPAEFSNFVNDDFFGDQQLGY